MKNQYFGDIIDLFKYDLLETLHRELKLSGISFVPMLTPNEEKPKKQNEGNKRNFENKAGSKNENLLKFIKQIPEKKEDRNFREIETYFRDKIDFEIFEHLNLSEYFEHPKRIKHFEHLLENKFEKQVVFFDPDNGMEVKKNNHRHVKFDELKMFYKAMSEDSVIVVIQFRPRITWGKLMNEKLPKAKIEITEFINYITNDHVGFFVFSKSETTSKSVQTILENYQRQYKNVLEIKH